MAQKTHIAALLGERALALPALVNAALEANDRAKYYLSLLQAAVAQARSPRSPAADLRRERLACGIDDPSLDDVVPLARAEADGRYHVPGAGRIVRQLLADVAAMLAPFGEAAPPGARERFAALKSKAEVLHGDLVESKDVDALARAAPEGEDSVHRLVMDLHKALNALQASIASETVEGASAYGIEAGDRVPLAAFMRGLRRTAPLKFDHPGLGTTATRIGTALVIQNDIGMTDAHVVIVRVARGSVSVTYSDVHLPRLLFFQNLFERYAVEWQDTFSRRDEAIEGGVFHVCAGTFNTASARERDEFLAFLASRLVFLIDWNKARKRLRELVSKEEAARLLAWAAQNDCGHMGFLKAGGELLVYDALDFVMKGRVRFGQKLSQIVGKSEASEFLRFVLKTAAEGFLRGEPESYVQDAVRAELFNSFRSQEEQMHDVVADHAALAVELAGGVRDTLLALRVANAEPTLARNAARARQWESRADDLVLRARGGSADGDTPDFFGTIVEAADVAVDELEEAAFNATLLTPAARQAAATAGIAGLGELLVQAAQEYVKVVETARHVRRGGVREDTQDFLAGIHRILEVERDADRAQRAIRRSLVAGADDSRGLYVSMAMTHNLERAAGAFKQCGLAMRDHVLTEVLPA